MNEKTDVDNHDNLTDQYSNQSERRRYSAAVINLGCKVNRYEADSMRKLMADGGIELVEPDEIADFYIVNTCSVTNIAERKSRQMLRRAKRRNPSAVVIAAGCYVNAAHDELLKLDFVDAVIGNDKKKNIMDVLKKYMITDGKDYFVSETLFKHDGHKKEDVYIGIDTSGEFEEMGSLSASYLDHRRAYIKIQDGCNQFCSYCIIPYTRGRIRSRAPENVIEEITGMAKSGVKEFVLTGIHISSYGMDFNNDSRLDDKCDVKDLGDLICEVAKIPEVKRIRLGSLEPRIITPDFLDKIAGVDKLCPHFHLSLQSACNETLKRMNRKYSIEEYMECVGLLRKYYDRPAITTDVIVGFPGETENEFSITLNNLKKLSMYEIHVFKYSVRRGTVASKLPDQVPENVKNDRSDILLELTAKQKKEYEASLAGLEDEVLIEEAIKSVDEKKYNYENGIADNYELNDNDYIHDENATIFTGYTKRYVRVNLESEGDIVGEIITYTF